MFILLRGSRSQLLEYKTCRPVLCNHQARWPVWHRRQLCILSSAHRFKEELKTQGRQMKVMGRKQEAPTLFISCLCLHASMSMLTRSFTLFSCKMLALTILYISVAFSCSLNYAEADSPLNQAQLSCLAAVH